MRQKHFLAENEALPTFYLSRTCKTKTNDDDDDDDDRRRRGKHWFFFILTRLQKGTKLFPPSSLCFFYLSLSLSLSHPPAPSFSFSLSLYSAPSPSPPLPSSSSLNAIAATPESAVVLTAPFFPTAANPFQRTMFFFFSEREEK